MKQVVQAYIETLIKEINYRFPSSVSARIDLDANESLRLSVIFNNRWIDVIIDHDYVDISAKDLAKQLCDSIEIAFGNDNENNP